MEVVKGFQNIRGLADNKSVDFLAGDARLCRNPHAAILAHPQIEVFNLLPFKTVQDFALSGGDCSLADDVHRSEPPQGNGLDVVDDLVDEIEGELQTALLFVFIEQIVDVL